MRAGDRLPAVHGISAERVVTDTMLTEPAVKRLIEPTEAAELVAYLCSPAPAFANGPVSRPERAVD